MVTSLSAALQGSPGIAIGNIIGSNIANTLLILGLTAIILPIPADPRSFRRDAPMLAIATLVCLAVVETSSVGRLSGALFLLLLAGYLWHTYRTEKQRHDAPALLHEQQGRLLEPAARSGALSAILALSGLAGILVGANLLVTASIQIAAALGIPDSIIGLTVVAVGTSLPELATSVAAAVKRQTDIALGNIIGSNIFNILGILGTTATGQADPDSGQRGRLRRLGIAWRDRSAVVLRPVRGAYFAVGRCRVPGAVRHLPCAAREPCSCGAPESERCYHIGVEYDGRRSKAMTKFQIACASPPGRCVSLLPCPATGSAQEKQMYQWTDQDGVVHFSDTAPEGHGRAGARTSP